jgi:transforming growth factor-beta-induced protein
MIALTMITVFNAQDLYAENNDKTKSNTSIVDIASSNEDFSILVEALIKADLVDALNAEGAFTVFAPNNAAFKQLFTALEVDGIKDLTKDQLTPILLYHVVNGKVMAEAVSTGSVPTLNQDSNLELKKSKKGVSINKTSKVVATDIEASNGVIHVIDAVLLPMIKTADNKKSKATKKPCSSSCN